MSKSFAGAGLDVQVSNTVKQYGLTSHRAERIKTLDTEDKRTQTHDVTGPDHSRIQDNEFVAAFIRANRCTENIMYIVQRFTVKIDNPFRKREAATYLNRPD